MSCTLLNTKAGRQIATPRPIDEFHPFAEAEAAQAKPKGMRLTADNLSMLKTFASR